MLYRLYGYLNKKIKNEKLYIGCIHNYNWVTYLIHAF